MRPISAFDRQQALLCPNEATQHVYKSVAVQEASAKMIAGEFGRPKVEPDAERHTRNTYPADLRSSPKPCSALKRPGEFLDFTILSTGRTLGWYSWTS